MTPWLELPDTTFYVGDCRSVLAARQLGRRSIYIDASMPYAEMARKRLEQQTPSLPIVAATPHEAPTQLSLTEATS